MDDRRRRSFLPHFILYNQGCADLPRCEGSEQFAGRWASGKQLELQCWPVDLHRTKLGVIIGLATLLGAEMFASRTGLGFEVAVSLARFDFARGYAAMFAAALVVYVLWLCLNSLELALSRKITFGFDKAARAI